MSSLRELQRDFLRAILDDPAAGAALPVISAGIAAAQRLQVYAANARGNFSSALEATYPVVRRLVGGPYFEQCARDFQHAHPSRSGDLQPAGAPFAAFIEALHGGGDHRYLGDVARFEWLVQEALLAPDHAPLDLSKLAAVPSEDYQRLEFHLHPSVRLFESPFPCLAIWQANSAAQEPPVIDLNGAPRERLAIMQSGGELRFHTLSAGEHAFLCALATRAPFGQAVDAGAAAVDPGAVESGAFDAAAALRRFVTAGAIVDFSNTPRIRRWLSLSCGVRSRHS